MMEQLISVIVPVYNIEQYVDKCLESILQQTYRQIEVVIIDDGSRDGTGNICDKYAEMDCRIKVIHQKNSGVVNARKNGMREAQGQLIAFVDGDDWVEPDMLEKLYCTMVKQGVDIVAAGYIKEFVAGGTNIHNTLESRKYGIYQDEFLKNALLTSENRIGLEPALWSKLFRADILKQCIESVEESIHYAEDLVLLWQYLVRVKNIYVLHDGVYHYRQRDDSCIHTCDEMYFEQINKVYMVLKYLFMDYGIYDKLSQSLGRWMFKHVMMGLNGSFDFTFSCNIPEYYFENQYFSKDTKLVLYGAGRVGKGYYVHIKNTKCAEVVAWVDKDYKKEELRQLGVVSIEDIDKKEYDYVLIATIYETMAKDISVELKKRGIPEEKIMWLHPKNYIN